MVIDYCVEKILKQQERKEEGGRTKSSFLYRKKLRKIITFRLNNGDDYADIVMFMNEWGYSLPVRTRSMGKKIPRDEYTYWSKNWIEALLEGSV